MTQPAQLEIGEQLDHLCLALARLDHAAVETCCVAVRALAPGLKGANGPSRDVSEIRSKLHLARTLTENAFDLYAGWARLAALNGAAYTTTGDEPAAPGATSSVTVEA